MTTEITILSIQVGRPRQHAVAGDNRRSPSTWTSAIVKRSVTGPVAVSLTNLDGDEQADRVHHGGPDKAILGYAAANYDYWRTELPLLELDFGAFGENLTLDGIDESTCCIGDVFAIGDCRLQVSQPRQPCWKLSRRWNVRDLAARVQKSGRTGWYYRVLAPGTIRPGMTLRMVERPYPRFTIAAASGVMYRKPFDPASDRELASCPALSESWKRTLLERATSGREPDSAARLEGRS
ncbi:MAG TPA: MOSC domain-containing protein [Planctomycetaceae bacterium]|nr:MOSC domain-containing protein [Planctomycetaceae bacterium]